MAVATETTIFGLTSMRETFAGSIDMISPRSLAVNLLVDEAGVFVEGFVCLSYDVVVLDVGCHVLDFVRYSVAYGAVFESFVNDLAVRSFDKAVLGYLCVCCEVGDKTDIRTFGSLDRAHSSVVRVVNVADFKGSSVT